MNTSVLQADRPAPSLARTVLGIFKLRIGTLIMITALAGLAMTPSVVPGRALSLAQVVVLALSVLGASAAAGAFNQWYEAESDRLMARTRGRAFASGLLQRSPAWLAVIIALLAASVMNCSGLSRNFPNVPGATPRRIAATVRRVSWVFSVISPSKSYFTCDPALTVSV